MTRVTRAKGDCLPPRPDLLTRLTAEFETAVQWPLRLSEEFRAAAERLSAHLRTRRLRPKASRRRALFAHVNCKFRINSEVMQRFLEATAGRGVTFNFHEKRIVQSSLDSANPDPIRDLLGARGISGGIQRELMNLCRPVTAEQTLFALHQELSKPGKLRKEVGERDIEREILESLFASFLFEALPTEEMHQFFDPEYSPKTYSDSFWRELLGRSPKLFNRSWALSIVRVTPSALSDHGTFNGLRNALASLIEEEHNRLGNHCLLALWLDPLVIAGSARHWELASDLVLFAEKHVHVPNSRAYFRWQEIEQETLRHIPGLQPSEARFDLSNEGFLYRDTFCILPESGSPSGQASLLVLLEKSQRDETVIHCPACRSNNVNGNSYPSLGVRSWECQNPICPERSKYNRGNRYSFKGLMMQAAIEEAGNAIPKDSVRGWARDVQDSRSEAEILEMLVRHYSLCGDAVHLWGDFAAPQSLHGRELKSHPLPAAQSKDFERFLDAPWFKRFVISPKASPSTVAPNLGTEELEVYCGDAAEVLSGVPAGTFAGAVTSPPYYNAREYSQWPNIYCYLHDMARVNAEVFRCLKPGAFYLYNIFDYFDNERSVAFSAMGKKRLILSAYTVDLFRRIGFECCGNIVWDKGEIEGKRGFNAGNFSPYYQSPFNCWEHVLIFQKPTRTQKRDIVFPQVLRARPVIKIVRGENVHGHSAPFPDELPGLLISRLSRGDRVLDPFAGSLTTGRVAVRAGVHATCVERHRNYCELGLRLRAEEQARAVSAERQLSLGF
jgi:DNA modification methylase